MISIRRYKWNNYNLCTNIIATVIKVFENFVYIILQNISVYCEISFILYYKYHFSSENSVLIWWKKFSSFFPIIFFMCLWHSMSTHYVEKRSIIIFFSVNDKNREEGWSVRSVIFRGLMILMLTYTRSIWVTIGKSVSILWP